MVRRGPRQAATEAIGGVRRRTRWKLWLALAAALALPLGIALYHYGEWVLAFADANLRVAFPDDLALTAPGPDVPPDIAAFAGLWGGDRWNGGELPHALAVEKIYPNGSATVVYAFGADQTLHRRHGWLRRRAEIADGHLVFTLPEGDTVDYAIGADGRLLGRKTPLSDWRSYALLRPIRAPRLADAVAAAARRSEPLWQEIRIPENARIGAAAGQHIELQATLYRTLLPGRRPLVILNPGANDRAAPDVPVRYEEQARFFLSLGYSVLVPMRKGRGDSGGPMIEAWRLGEGADAATQIASGLEDIDAAVTQASAMPFVDPRRIVLIGNQHGGLLSVLYAARHADKVAGVVNVSGGWWPEEYKGGAVNAEEFAVAGGAGATGPMLWLYAEGDPWYSVAHVARSFAAFEKAGGTGRLVILPDPATLKLFGDQLFEFTSKWEELVEGYLRSRASPAETPGVVALDLSGRGGKTILAAAFYPAIGTRRRLGLGPWLVEAVSHAPIRDGTFPVLLLAEGYGIDRFGAHDLAADLASRGFVVATISGIDQDPRDRAAGLDKEAIAAAAADLRAALAAMLADPVLGPHLDRSRIAAAGVGSGAAAALRLAADGAAEPAVRSLVLMAPELGPLDDPDALASIAVPVRLVAASKDDSGKANIERLRTALPHPPELAEVPGNRFVFLAPCPGALREGLGEICEDPPRIDRRAVHATLAAEIGDFEERALGER